MAPAHAALARQAGAGELTAVARSRRNEASAQLAGAAFRLVDGNLADIRAVAVIEATGDPAALKDAVAAARDLGTVVLLGSPRGMSEVPIGLIQGRGIRVVGAHVSALAKEAKRSRTDPFRELALAFLDGVAAGRLGVADLVGESVDPREPALLYRRLADGTLSTAHLDWRRLAPEQRSLRRGPMRMPSLPVRTAQVAADLQPPVTATTRPLRFAVIGCGDIGASNVRAVARACNAQLALVYDVVPALADTAAAYGGSVVRSLEQALDPGRVDAVLLSVPHDLHAPLIMQAARAGLHIAVEKPLAADLPSAREAIAVVERAGVTLSVIFPYRYETAPSTAHRLAAAGALGSFRGAAVVFHTDKPASYWHGGFSGRAQSGWRSSRERSGGGVMIMNLTHHVDLLRYVTGCEAIEVSAMALADAGHDVEDEIAATVRFVGGAVGTLLGSASTRGVPRSRLEVWGDVGTVQLEPEARIYTDRAVPGLVTGRWNALPTDPVNERVIFIERFAAAVLEERSPDVTAMDGFAVQALVSAVYRSMESGRTEPVESTTSLQHAEPFVAGQDVR